MDDRPFPPEEPKDRVPEAPAPRGPRATGTPGTGARQQYQDQGLRSSAPKGKGRGKGSKGSKAKQEASQNSRYQQDQEPSGTQEQSPMWDIQELVETNRKVTLRLCTQMRDIHRLTAYVLLIFPEAEDLRMHMDTSRQEYLAVAPKKGEGKGQHQDGKLPVYLFDCFKDWIEAKLCKIVEGHPTYQGKSAILSWLKGCFPDKSPSTIHSFGAIGNRGRVPTGVWVWGLTFDYLTPEGRKSHEILADLLGCGYLENNEFRIQRDNAPVDGMERALANMRIS